MNRRRACVVSVVLSATTVTARGVRAQETAALEPTDAPAPARAMTVTQALAYARAHQPAIHAALSRVAMREQEARIPAARWLPKLTATAQLFAMTANNSTGTYVTPDFMDIPRIGATSTTDAGTFSPFASTFVGVGALQEIFDFGRIGAQRAAADAWVAVEKHNADTAILDVDFGVEESFFAVLAAKGVVRAADEAYTRSLVHRDLAERGVNSGLRSPIELTRAEADLARYDVGRVRARGGLSVAQTVLAASVGVPDPALDAADGALQPSDTPTLSDALAMAQQRSPRLAGAISQLKRTEDRARAIGAELRPDLRYGDPLRARGRCTADCREPSEWRRVDPRRPQLGCGSRPDLALVR